MSGGAKRAAHSSPVLYTIGHSTHSSETFLGLLRQHRIALLADVRSFPSSRRWPQFNQAELKPYLELADIAYRWLKSLGGRRHSKRADSPHVAWNVDAFRSYADYADTPEFEKGLDELLQLALAQPAAIMCAEGLWWRCHRRIISDHVAIRGWDVRHVMPDGKLAAHALPDFASVKGSRIIYGGRQCSLNLE
jgi:uncharacterized protein (DUF488 family)